MKSVYDFCLSKWGEALVKPQRAKLSEIMLLTVPEDMALLKKADKSKTIVIQKNTSIYTCLQILKMGFSHCLDSSQPDFDREVLVSSLMLINPTALVDSSVPFFLRGLNQESSVASHATTSIEVANRREIPMALKQLMTFFTNANISQNLSDVVTFTADELLSNGLNAQVKKGLSNLPVHLFMGIDKTSFVIGCIDSAGSLDRDTMLDKLSAEFAGETITANPGSGGAGIGLRLVLDGASSLYIHSVPNRKTIFCCGFKLKNIKSNLTRSKHLHFTNSNHL